MDKGNASCEIKFDTAAITARISNANREATFAVGAKVKEDSNAFCKVASGELKRSAIVYSASDLSTVVWEEPYARRQYYLTATSKDPNELATPKWFETAKGYCGDKWQQIYKEAFKKSF